jgi:hypothetical protein
VEIYDPTRNVSVRLFGDSSYQNSPETGGWSPLYSGYWQ